MKGIKQHFMVELFTKLATEPLQSENSSGASSFFFSFFFLSLLCFCIISHTISCVPICIASGGAGIVNCDVSPTILSFSDSNLLMQNLKRKKIEK